MKNMQRIATVLVFGFYITASIHAQEIPVTTEQQLENSADSEPEDDSYQQELDHFRKKPR